ncbi:Uncharacterised protein [Chlamydia abortus]|nr:Uncharacterised protein [Chlamydia abortus]
MSLSIELPLIPLATVFEDQRNVLYKLLIEHKLQLVAYQDQQDLFVHLAL